MFVPRARDGITRDNGLFPIPDNLNKETTTSRHSPSQVVDALTEVISRGMGLTYWEIAHFRMQRRRRKEGAGLQETSAMVPAMHNRFLRYPQQGSSKTDRLKREMASGGTPLILYDQGTSFLSSLLVTYGREPCGIVRAYSTVRVQQSRFDRIEKSDTVGTYEVNGVRNCVFRKEDQSERWETLTRGKVPSVD